MTTREFLIQRSIQIITQNQDGSGAYVASPNFPEYRFSWLRDGSFIGYAMLLCGKTDSAERFLRWVADAICRNEPDWPALEAAGNAGTPPPAGAYLPTRFTLSGEIDSGQWPDFQIDGYGHWLWLLGEWITYTRQDGVPSWATKAVDTTIRYLGLTWHLPNHDAWEEHGDKVHPSTLASVYGGLRSMHRLGYAVSDLADRVRELVGSQLTLDGSIPKHIGSQEVDSSALWAAVPFGLFEPTGEIMTATTGRIERELTIGGGVIRFKDDTYYGGGRWILLTAWLGWYALRCGDVVKAESCAKWIEERMSPDGALPEQVVDQPVAPAMVGEWQRKWGKVAEPLLWSHAMYLILTHEMEHSAGVAGNAKVSQRRRSV